MIISLPSYCCGALFDALFESETTILHNFFHFHHHPSNRFLTWCRDELTVRFNCTVKPNEVETICAFRHFSFGCVVNQVYLLVPPKVFSPHDSSPFLDGTLHHQAL